jgi:cyclic pyranopterin phosphate synthase
MVDITTKSPTSRSATATGRVLIPERACIALTSSPDGRSSAKGDVLSVAQLAGLMGAKRTSDLIPLCHPLSLTNVDVRLELCADAASNKRWIQVVAKAECKGATGVEMEALTAVSVACLTVWDMLKAVGGKDMVIEGVMVTSKSGGKSGDWTREVEQ